MVFVNIAMYTLVFLIHLILKYMTKVYAKYMLQLKLNAHSFFLATPLKNYLLLRTDNFYQEIST